METIQKPWGMEKIFAHTEKYVGKILYIKKGHSLSLQYHETKEETVMVLKGQMGFRFGSTVEEAYSNVKVLNPGDVFHIPPKLIHRMIALEDTEVVEVSTPELNDVVRLEDFYGRE
jgi:quercetin dioxygenase-like cupin family protein